MARVTQDDATVEVFCFKEGLLSAVGHDVKLTVGRFSLDFEDGGVRGVFQADSVRAVCAMKDGVEDRHGLSDKDRHTIDGYVANDILDVRRHPRVTFSADEVFDNGDGTFEIDGTLSLHGTDRAVSVTAEEDGSDVVAEVTLHQPAYGIKPFSAMLGTLKIKPDVVVRVRLPAAAVT